MKPWGLPGVQSLESWEELRRFVTQGLTSVIDALTGKLTYSDNFRQKTFIVGPLGDYQWPATGPVVLQHGLGSMSGFQIMGKNGVGDVYQDTSFLSEGVNSGKAYLLTNNSAVTYKIMVLG